MRLLDTLENPLVQDLLILVFLLAISFLTYYLVKRYVLNLLRFLFRKTRTKWDDFLFEQGVFNTLAFVIPIIILLRGLPFLQVLPGVVEPILHIIIVVVLGLSVDRLLKAGLLIYNSFPVSARMPIKGYVQIGQIALWIFVGATIFSLLLGQSPWIFISGLGALSAILLLVFQDTILSFIAGLQLTINDQIRVGDWIEVPGYGADGDVEEVALHTVKVRNWDKSITTIPTHKLVGDAFKNWRGMFESGGRRIKRSILIDQNSVRFCDQEMLDRFSKIQLLQEYLQVKKEEVAKYNREHNIDFDSLVNGRHLTNLGTFRAYLLNYLRSHPGVNQDMIIMVRQLQPTTNGLPMEIYVFSQDVAWVNYENLQGDLFDHILAIVPEFGLQIFQNPGGHDLAIIGSEGRSDR